MRKLVKQMNCLPLTAHCLLLTVYELTNLLTDKWLLDVGLGM